MGDINRRQVVTLTSTALIAAGLPAEAKETVHIAGQLSPQLNALFEAHKRAWVRFSNSVEAFEAPGYLEGSKEEQENNNAADALDFAEYKILSFPCHFLADQKAKGEWIKERNFALESGHVDALIASMVEVLPDLS